MNREFSNKIIKSLLEWGVVEFYICAGARDIPLIETVVNISSDKKIVFNHFEERSAAFYALGRIKSLGAPVAVITTSGTAAGELLPAVMEAYYSGLPLVLLTADRPKSYRGTGAPQCAEQKDIFGNYVSKCLDLEIKDEYEISYLPKNKPLHLNVCFDIPLQSGVLEKISFLELKNKSQNNLFLEDEKYLIDKKKLEQFIKQSTNLIVIVAQIFEKENKHIIDFIKSLNCLVYLESISNMREVSELNGLKINSAHKMWENLRNANYAVDSVLKIGGTPTHRVWRDLDESYKQIKVLSVSNNVFSGMPNADNISTSINMFFSKINSSFIFSKFQKINEFKNHFLNLDNECYVKLYEFFKLYPQAEQSIFFHLSNKIKANSRVYLGNSLSIRYWDLAATFEDKQLIFDASRGLNGIDGQISSCLGFADEACEENWGVFGDLTTLYDFAGLWMMQHRPTLKINLVIINNGGGGIFKNVLTGPSAILCQNSHNLNFEQFAKFWGMAYEKVFSVDEIKNSQENKIIEILPNIEQTDLFSNKLKY